MRAAIGLLIALVVAMGAASEVAACTVLAVEPELQRRFDLEDQRRVRASADAVFLARARPKLSRSGTLLTSIVAIDGDGPREVFLPYDTSDCMPSAPPRGVVIVFARRIRVADAPWKFWTWGRWVVTGRTKPSEGRGPGPSGGDADCRQAGGWQGMSGSENARR
jgi:hypothetical protein